MMTTLTIFVKEFMNSEYAIEEYKWTITHSALAIEIRQYIIANVFQFNIEYGDI